LGSEFLLSDELYHSQFVLRIKKTAMKKNMGTIDKSIRLALAGVVLLLVLFNVISGVLAYILLAVAVIFALTNLISFCPLYLPFRISTRKKE